TRRKHELKTPEWDGIELIGVAETVAPPPGMMATALDPAPKGHTKKAQGNALGEGITQKPPSPVRAKQPRSSGCVPPLQGLASGLGSDPQGVALGWSVLALRAGVRKSATSKRTRRAGVARGLLSRY